MLLPIRACGDDPLWISLRIVSALTLNREAASATLTAAGVSPSCLTVLIPLTRGLLMATVSLALLPDLDNIKELVFF